MIVICTGCQARFRVADEKIGPRGAKVRCTRCQNVFVVKREAAPPAPLVDLDLTPGLARPAPGVDPFAAPGAFPGAAARSGAPSDPFAAAGLDAFGGARSAGDPFAQSVKQPTVKFPAGELGASGLLDDGAGLAQDPFAAASFGPAGPTPTVSQSLPVTDLAQLLGGAAAPGPHQAPPPLPPQAEEPEPAELEAAPAFAAFGEDLTLEDRRTADPAPASFAEPAGPLPGATSFAAAFPPGVWDDGPLPPSAAGDEPLALATDPTPGPGGHERLAVPPAEDLAPPRPPPRPRPEAVQAEPAAASAHPPLTLRRGIVRSAAVNALALVALVAVALGIRVVLRGDAPLGPGALRPSRLLQALRGERAPDAPFEVAEVRTGVYPQSSGGSVLFVRGVVICRKDARAGGVKVAAELVRDGQVMAQGEIVAGAVPTPEEVWKASDRAGLEALAAELSKRAPKRVAAGDRLGFLVTIADAPADLDGTSVRLQAGAAAR